jgi:hypothetical protein
VKYPLTRQSEEKKEAVSPSSLHPYFGLLISTSFPLWVSSGYFASNFQNRWKQLVSVLWLAVLYVFFVPAGRGGRSLSGFILPCS